MGSELIHLGIVTSSLIVLVVVPLLPVSFLLFRGQQWPKIVLSAMVLGCSVQASIGLLWSHLAGKWPLYEIAALAVAWLLLLGWSIRQAGRRNIVVWDPDNEPIHPGLILILCIGFIIRVIHPVEVFYLGQSDAYTHLNYIHNINAFGYLINPVYPPGFHWIMALPSLVFSIDPYNVARFGGAFFGTGMVLGIYVLLDQCVSRRAALYGSFCAAAFPGMTLLMKTGVGVFANQFGLFLLPAVFMYYILTVTNRSRGTNDGWLLLFALCGMAAAVPMMMLHVLLIIGLEHFLMLLRTWRKWFGKTLQITVLIIPAVCLFTFHIGHVGGGHRFQTAEIMTGYSGKKQTAAVKMADRLEKKIVALKPETGKLVSLVTQSPYFKLVLDYGSVKRKGFGNIKLDILGGLLTVLFTVLLCTGLVRGGTSYIVIGAWGLLTSIQAGTGLLQFSSYQREGWSLLIATCCLSGIIAAWIYQFGQHSRLFRAGVLALMAASAAWCFLHPPSHFPIRSSGEGELIRTVRYLGQLSDGRKEGCDEKDDSLCSLKDLRSGNLDTVLVTRRYVGWGNQGEIAQNVMPPDSTMPVLIVDNRVKEDIFQPGRQYLVLVDNQNNLSGQQVVSAFAMVTPAMVQATLNNRNRLFKINSMILEQIKNLPSSQWDIEHVTLSENLWAVIVTPAEAT